MLQEAHVQPQGRAARFNPQLAASLEAARGRKIALLLSMEYEGIYHNGGIGTYYREISRLFRRQGWFTMLLDLSSRAPAHPAVDLPDLQRVFRAAELETFLLLEEEARGMLSSANHNLMDVLGIRSLLFIEAVAGNFSGQQIYAEFHEMCGPGYHAAKAKECGRLGPDVVVAVTMHSGHEWIYESNGALASQENAWFLQAAAREEDSFRCADLAMFPSDSLHRCVDSYGWRTAHATKLPYSIPQTARHTV